MRRMKIRAILWGTVILMLLTGGLLSAAEYPTKAVSLLVGFPPGGPNDLSARAVAEAAKAFFPKPITVVNKPGGGGVVATSDMMRSLPDGYTLGQVDITHMAVAPHLEAGLPYKGPEDLSYVISTASGLNGLAVKADAPWKTIKEFLDYVKANPGKVRVGNSGISTSPDLCMRSLTLAGVPVTNVPFAGAAPCVTAILGGHTEAACLNLTPLMPHVKSGKLKFLATFTKERFKDTPELKDVPTFRELGYKDVLTVGSDYFVGAPLKTPQYIINILYESLLKAEKTDFYRNFCRDNFLIVPMMGPAELKKETERNYAFFRDFLDKAGLKSMPKK